MGTWLGRCVCVFWERVQGHVADPGALAGEGYVLALDLHQDRGAPEITGYLARRARSGERVQDHTRYGFRLVRARGHEPERFGDGRGPRAHAQSAPSALPAFGCLPRRYIPSFPRAALERSD